MKRLLPPAPEPRAALRRRRALSEEERALWESVAKQVKPLRKKPRLKMSNPAAIEESSIAARPAGKSLPAPAAKRLTPARPPPLAPLGRRERSQLSRGRKDIEARLDLHGMTQSRAHRALQSFLQRASSDGLTFVLVITGKGTATSDSGRGVLRRQVPEWLNLPEFRALVVGFEQAHIGHGGEGALYVRVRRAR
jgi:DNA-nicking Smr family endonuclease